MLVDAVEQVAVVDEEVRPAAFVVGEHGDGEVDAEDHHVAAALAVVAVDVGRDLQAVSTGLNAQVGIPLSVEAWAKRENSRMASDCCSVSSVLPRSGDVRPDRQAAGCNRPGV